MACFCLKSDLLAVHLLPGFARARAAADAGIANKYPAVAKCMLLQNAYAGMGGINC